MTSPVVHPAGETAPSLPLDLISASSSETLRTTLIDHLVSAIRNAEGSDAPFSHIYIRNVFPEPIYQWILDHPPETGLFSHANHRDARRDDGTSTRQEIVFASDLFDRMSPEDARVWRVIYESLQSDALRDALAERLAKDLTRTFRIDREDLASRPRTMFIRDLAGYWIAPHKDVRRKHITMQMYLPSDESQESLGTTIYGERWGRRTLYWLKRMSRILPRTWRHRLYLREDRTFPFLPNSGYAFAVGDASWHGRSVVPSRHVARDSLMHIYYEREAAEVRHLH